MKSECYIPKQDSPGYCLWSLSNLWQRHMRNALASLDLTHVQFLLLVALWHTQKCGEQVTQVELAHFININIMMASKVLRTLEAKHYVARTHHEHDTRAKYIELTKAGEQAIESAIKAVQDLSKHFFHSIDRDKFLAELQTLLHDNELPEEGQSL